MQKQFPLSVFVFIDSLVVSASQDAGGYAIFRQNNLELHLGCHTCLLSYFTLVCLWWGRTVGQSGVQSRDYQTFIGWVDYHIFLDTGLRSRAWSLAIGQKDNSLENITWSELEKKCLLLLL